MKDVAFSCDDNGAKFLRVTVWSLLKHYKGAEPIRINVFEGFGGHSEESKSKLKSVVEGFNEVKVNGGKISVLFAMSMSRRQSNPTRISS